MMSQSAVARAPWVVRTFDPILRGMLRRGLPLGPNSMLTVRGRKTGEPRSAAVAVLQIDGRRWIQGAYGEVHWVHNLRAAGRAVLRVDGRDMPIRARALTPAEAEAFFRNDVRTYVGNLPWLWRGVGWIFARQLLRDPAGAAQRIPVFELMLDQDTAAA
jgi:deazaflavin-dependent oxidoreductase (nitroreductase family)